MAAGVPLVVDDRGGWREMIEHGHTGFLCASDADFVRHATALAEDDSLRMRIAHAARAAVERLTDPATIGAAWLNLFSDLE
jgi:glycosyltransferase involved in cell wall biosynthesis